jgi:hypothetical protein
LSLKRNEEQPKRQFCAISKESPFIKFK